MKIKIVIFIIISALYFIYIPSTPIADEKGEFSVEIICKAAIAKIMGRDPKIIKTTAFKSNKNIIYLSYIRKNDGSKWSYRCKIIENKIIWATDGGRWRDHPEDSKLTFRVSGTILYIEEDYGDGSSAKKKFKLKELTK